MANRSSYHAGRNRRRDPAEGFSVRIDNSPASARLVEKNSISGALECISRPPIFGWAPPFPSPEFAFRLLSLERTRMRRMLLFRLLLSFCVFLIILPAQARALRRSASELQQQTAAEKLLVTIRGRVVDARTGEPIAKVKVIADGVGQSTTTDDIGAFTLENLPVGKLDLYIT